MSSFLLGRFCRLDRNLLSSANACSGKAVLTLGNSDNRYRQSNSTLNILAFYVVSVERN